MHLYRLAKKKFARDITGEGSRLYGGRWNHAGTPCVYTAENRALTILEYSVSIDLEDVPRALSLITLEVPNDSVTSCETADLPGNWKKVPAPVHTKNFGNRLLQEKTSLLIKIPSTIIPQEFNYIINPLHALIDKVKIVAEEDFVYDVRIKD